MPFTRDATANRCRIMDEHKGVNGVLTASVPKPSVFTVRVWLLSVCTHACSKRGSALLQECTAARANVVLVTQTPCHPLACHL